MKSSIFAHAILLVLVAACTTDIAHKNFLTIMQNQVGKNLDDPYTTRNRYPERRISVRSLVNGNTEEEFQTGGKSCRVFFEIDSKEKKIVGWRYEGAREECLIVP